MISAWHLAWIIPVSAVFGLLFAAMVKSNRD